jgi:DnaJ family protein A protein 2
MQEEDEGPVDTTQYYEVLGIEKDCTPTEVKKAYRKKARELHPDRHPDEREKYQALFQEVQQAHEILKDEKNRSIYDQHGSEAAKRGQVATGGDIFSHIFGDRAPAETHGKKQSPPIKKVMNVTLEDLYRGATKVITIDRYTADGDSSACNRCHGSGVVTVVQRMGPMMIQQRAECNVCDGMGYQLASEEVDIEVHVPVGARHGESHVVRCEGHRYPDHSPGDVTVQFRQVKHQLYKRQGADLGMNYTLSLRQALCGYKIRLKHVSLKTLVVTPSKGSEIVQPGSLKRIFTMGMPQRFTPHIKGHLYIVMEVEMPLSRSLKPEQLQQFREILPDNEPENEFGDDTEVDAEMKDTADEASKTAKQQNKNNNLNNNHHGNNNNNNNNNKSNKQNNRKNRNNKRNNKNNKNRKNKNNRKNNSMKDMFGGLYENNGKNKNKRNRNKANGNNNNSNNGSNGSNGNNGETGEIEDDILLEDVECIDVNSNPKATPASARGINDEDDDQDGVQCRQM